MLISNEKEASRPSSRLNRWLTMILLVILGFAIVLERGGSIGSVGIRIDEVVLAIAIFALIGLPLWQIRAMAQHRRKYPAPGTMVDVGGHRLHVHCAGEGCPTVVVDGGLSGNSLYWWPLLQELSRTTRVCVYERAGHGWSETGPKPRTSQQIVNEMHALLTNAGIEGPYVLAGEDFGTLNIRLYAHQYPDNVVGLILVNPIHEDEFDVLPNSLLRIKAAARRVRRTAFRARMGWLRYSSGHLFRSPRQVMQQEAMSPFPPEQHAAYWSFLLHPKTYRAMYEEALCIEQNMHQVRKVRQALPIPVMVVARQLMAQDVQNWDMPIETLKQVSQELAENLTKLSTNSVIITVKPKMRIPTSLDQPEIITEAIREVVEAVRTGKPLADINTNEESKP